MDRKFNKFVDCVKWVKKSTYLIVRWIKINDWEIQRETLWTWVLVKWWKLLTCEHVVSWWHWHSDWCQYFLVNRDNINTYHWSIQQFTLWKTLFLYKNFDLAVMYLNDGFFQNEKNVFKSKDEYLEINVESQDIWADVWILWYPECLLKFRNANMMDPIIWDIILRTDKWVINWKYIQWWDYNIILEEFTIQFNPWNSWWPIFDIENWKLIWLVKWYKEIKHFTDLTPFIIVEESQDGKKTETKNYDYYKSYYSIWIPVENYFNILKGHQIIE